MNLKDYLKELMPRLKRTELEEAITKLNSELTETVIPSYETAAEFFGTRKFKSKWVEQFDKLFEKEFKVKYKGNFIAGINTTLALLMENLNSIQRLTGKTEATWSKDAVSLLGVNLLRAVDQINFLTQYARRLLNVTLTMETNVAEGKDEKFEIQRSEIEWLNINKTMFLGSYSILTMKRADLERRLAEVPNVIVGEENASMLEGNLERAQTDPLGLGLIPLQINLFYHIGRFMAERQAARYKSSIAERDAIQMRLVYLRQLEQNSADPILRQEIEVAQGRVEKLNYSIKEMEEKWI